MSEVITVRRDGSVVLDDEVIGYVHGEPRNWQFDLADYREPAGRFGGTHMWHSKREAAEMCVRAHRETPARKPHSEQRQRTILVALRLLPAERDTLQAAAQARKVSLSEFIRSSALGATKSGP